MVIYMMEDWHFDHVVRERKACAQLDRRGEQRRKIMLGQSVSILFRNTAGRKGRMRGMP